MRKNGILVRFSARLILAAGLGLAVSTPAVVAQELNSDSIVQQLAPKKKFATRGLKSAATAPEMSSDQKTYLKSLPTRGLKVEMKKEVAVIMDTYDLPQINIEIQFDYNSAKIKPGSVPDLNALGTALLSHELSGSRILLNGHTDAAGSQQFNMGLSEKRADAVRDYLISRFGIEPDRLIAIGFGEERLKNRHDPEAAENRRVEVVNLNG